MAAGSLTLGGNMSIAVGPIGRNGEASGSLNTSGGVAAMYSYSKTKGLFGGISIEGSMIVERQDANAQAYRSGVTAKQLLSGSIDPPEWTSALVKTLEDCTGMTGNRQWIQDNTVQSGYAFNGVGSPGSQMNPSSKGKANKKKPSFPPAHWGNTSGSAAYFDSNSPDDDLRSGSAAISDDRLSGFETHFESDFASEVESHQRPRFGEETMRGFDNISPDDPAPPYDPSSFGFPNHTNHARSASSEAPVSSSKPHKKSFSYAPSSNPFYATEEDNEIVPTSRATTNRYIQPKPELVKPLSPSEGVARAIALFDFKAVEPGDLSFSKGDIITITQKSDSTDDWWTGNIGGSRGIFPANHVEVV